MQDGKMTKQKYKSLVLTALYIEARCRKVLAASLPPDVLSSLGVAVEKAEDPRFKLADGLKCSVFRVDAPSDLDAPEVRARIIDLELRLKENRRLLAMPPGSKKRAWKRREPDIGPDDGGAPVFGSVDDLPERI